MKSIQLWINEQVGLQTLEPSGLSVRRFVGRSKGQQWPACSELRDEADSGTMLGVTFNSDSADIVHLLEMAKEWSDEVDAGFVYCRDVVPADLLVRIPSVLHRFLRIPQAMDLVCVGHQCSEDGHSELSMVEAALKARTVAATTADGTREKTPDIDRFPPPSPGKSIIRMEHLQESVLSVLEKLKLPRMEQRCIESGILLLWDFPDASHEISQTMEGKGTPRTADYWHGIMHRREPDAGNASYWFRRVGHHPAFEELSDHLLSWVTEIGATVEQQGLVRQKILRQQKFDPFALIELSQQAIRSPGSDADAACRTVQYLEILNLLAWSCGSADAT